jgi:hypothetical protein
MLFSNFVEVNRGRSYCLAEDKQFFITLSDACNFTGGHRKFKLNLEALVFELTVKTQFIIFEGGPEKKTREDDRQEGII